MVSFLVEDVDGANRVSEDAEETFLSPADGLLFGVVVSETADNLSLSFLSPDDGFVASEALDEKARRCAPGTVVAPERGAWLESGVE